MRAKDLMIGDWVYDIILQGYTKVEVLTLSGIKGTIHDNVWHEKTFEPIPLTPEILEKNGFGEQRFERMSVWSILGFSIELDFSTWKYYWANGDVEISSVHELQHALRLCGITKEIQI